MKRFFILGALILAAGPAHAACPLESRVYVDQTTYELRFDRDTFNRNAYPGILYYFKITNKAEGGKQYAGAVSFAGYKTPHVTIGIPCPQEDDRSLESRCRYLGTVQTVDEDGRTAYGFGDDETLPIEFPMMSRGFKFAGRVSGEHPAPSDVWRFKECRE